MNAKCGDALKDEGTELGPTAPLPGGALREGPVLPAKADVASPDVRSNDSPKPPNRVFSKPLRKDFRGPAMSSGDVIPWTSEDDGDLFEVYAKLIHEAYEEYNPAKLPELPALLQRYRALPGGLREMYHKVLEKYDKG